MHKRASNSVAYAEAVRARIRGGHIVKYLSDHIDGKRQMSKTQVQAALGLLKKVVPDISAFEHSGPGGEPLPAAITIHLVKADA
jgi:hypothetical protein